MSHLPIGLSVMAFGNVFPLLEFQVIGFFLFCEFIGLAESQSLSCRPVTQVGLNEGS